MVYNGIMKKLIVYFHGYGSSANSDKVTRLSQDFETYCFNAPVDFDIAEKSLTENIDFLLVTNPEEPVELIFVGTSLGAWTANELAKQYGCHAVIINPSVDPSTSLKKYGVSDEICGTYYPMIPSKDNKYFFAEVDEVIPNEQYREKLIAEGYDVTVVCSMPEKSNHRFNGDSFEFVVDYLKGKGK
jgi:hypothetical protein